MNNIFRLSFILAIVTTIAAFVLAEIYQITRPQIEIQKQAKTKDALKYVLPDAQVIVPVTQKVPVKDKAGNVLYEKEVVRYYIGYRNSDTTGVVGYAFKAFGSGYSSIIETMVSVDTSGTIKKIRIISQKETPGLGARCVEDQPVNPKKKQWTTQQFVGKTVDQLKVDKDGGPIVSITGATITSRAITNSIREKLSELLPQLKLASTENIGG